MPIVPENTTKMVEVFPRALDALRQKRAEATIDSVQNLALKELNLSSIWPFLENNRMKVAWKIRYNKVLQVNCSCSMCARGVSWTLGIEWAHVIWFHGYV